VTAIKTGAPVVVLVADDNPDARRMYATYLEHLGMHVLTARDGVDCLQKASRLSPDVIVMDISMPQLTGDQAAQALKANAATRDIPIVGMTALGLQGLAEVGTASGVFDALVEKPCLPQDLARIIEGLMDRVSTTA
jgi:CheY-like chemotaxis protein